jgi:hypothetical protein
MANARKNSDGRTATRATGQASASKSTGSRGFIPQGQKSANSPKVIRTAGKLSVGPRTASGKG